MKIWNKYTRSMLVPLMGAEFTFAMAAAAFAQTATTTATSISSSKAVQTINSSTLQGQSLAVPSGSTYVINVNSTSPVNLSGNFSNSGTIYLVSSNSAVHTANISATNIFNQQGALLTTVLPVGGIAGFMSQLNLSLSAINNIVNYGTISSAGSLNLNAGNSIVNQLPAGMSGPNPVMTAVQNLNMQATNIINSGLIASQLASVNAYTSNLVNSGAMQALSSQINVQNLLSNVLNVNNLNGILSAGSSINFSTLASVYDSGKNLLSEAVLKIDGGKLDAPLVSINSPGGKISVNVEQINGGLNLSGATAFVDVSAGGLRISNLALTGDPILATSGTLDLSGLFFSASEFDTFGGDFIALAGGDIIAPGAPMNSLINAQSSTGNGGQIFLSAGTNFTVINPACTVCQLGIDYTLGAPSPSGGSIVLPNVGLLTNCNSISLLAHNNSYYDAFSASETRNPGSISIGNITLCCDQSQHEQINTFPITLLAPGNITVASITNLAGPISVQSLFGNLSVLSDQTIQSFGSNVSLAAGNKFSTGDNVSLSAVGGDLLVDANQICTGANNKFDAFQTAAIGGNLSLTSIGKMNLGGNNGFHADTSLNLTSLSSEIQSSSQDSFLSCDDDIKLTACGINLGDSNTFKSLGGSLIFNSQGGDINTGVSDSFQSFQSNNQGGDIIFTSNSGAIQIANLNTFSAVGGNILVSAATGLSTGSDMQMAAYNQNAAGGNITLLSTSGDISLGVNNLLDAVGGSIVIKALNGALTLGVDDKLNAFASGNSGAGNISVLSADDLMLSAGAVLNAVGGNIDIQSTTGTVQGATGADLCTFEPLDAQSANVNISAFDDLVLTGVSIGAANNVSLLSTGKSIFLDSDTIAAGGNSSGGNLVLSAAKDINLIKNNSLFAYGNIDLTALADLNLGSASIGNNDLCSRIGDIKMTAASINLGQHDSVQANDGSVTLTATLHSVNLGQFDLLQAGGGNLTLTSSLEDVNLGSNNELDAFFKLSNPAIGGSVLLNAALRTVNLGSNNDINAVGGDVKINSLNVELGSNNTVCIFPNDGQATDGDFIISVPGDLLLTDQAITVFGNFLIQGATITLNNDQFIAMGGDLSLVSTVGNVQINENNILAAFSTAWLPGAIAPYTGGNVFITSARDINFDSPSGGIANESLPDEPYSNIVQAVGGNIVMSAARGFEAKFDNVFISSKIMPDGTCGDSGGGIYIFTGGADVFPLPLPNSALNVFAFDDKHVNIDPNPPSFSPQTNAAGIPIHQESGAGGDPSMIDVSEGGEVSLFAGEALIHLLSTDVTAKDGIVYMSTGNQKSQQYSIQIKDSSLAAGCVPIIVPP
ncbi:MAG: hypothetical protein K2X27_04080, partial [Candidatus Obscuribacterales bacterium]|nr:hypothetical protein [Candidatus Obscuribacterales bacterium]